MWRSLAVLGVLASGALADRKDAGLDVPPLGEVTSVDLELGPPIKGPRCQPLTWSIHVDVATNTWTRREARCTKGPTSEAATAASFRGKLDAARRATFDAAYGKLDERVPKICPDSNDQLLTATVHRKRGADVQLVDRGCENPARLRELAALLAALKP